MEKLEHGSFLLKTRVFIKDSGFCAQVYASWPLVHLRTANPLKVNVPWPPQWKRIFVLPNESSPNDLPFGEALITESPLRSFYWYHGTRLGRLLIRLVALFCTSKLVFQLCPPPLIFPP